MNPTEKLASDQIFSTLSKSFWKYAFEAIVDGGGTTRGSNRNANVAVLIALALLAYAGVEVVNIVFRKKFGKKGVNVYRLILSTLAIVMIAIASFKCFTNYTFEDFGHIGSASSFLATGIFYMLLFVFILVKGILALSRKIDNAIHETYRGDSWILGFLAKGNWSPSLVQNLGEPLLLLSIGFCLMPVNLLLGIPLVFCAVSSWVHLLMETIMGVLGVRNLLSNKGYVHSNNTTFSEVIK